MAESTCYNTEAWKETKNKKETRWINMHWQKEILSPTSVCVSTPDMDHEAGWQADTYSQVPTQMQSEGLEREGSVPPKAWQQQRPPGRGRSRD